MKEMTKKVLLIGGLLLAAAWPALAQKARPQRTVFSDATQTTGTGDAIALAPSPALAALTDLDTVPPTQVCFVAEAVNTTTVTVAISGLTAKPLYKMNGAITTALAANDLRVGQFVCFVRYPTGDAFQMLTQIGNAPSGGSTTWTSSARVGVKQSSNSFYDVNTDCTTGSNAAGTDAFTYAVIDNAGSCGVIAGFYLDARFTTSGPVTLTFLGEADATATYTLSVDIACTNAGSTKTLSYGTAATGNGSMTGATLRNITVSSVVTTGCAAGGLMTVRTKRGTDTPSDAMYVYGFTITQ